MQIFELFGSILLKDPGISSQLDKIDKKASSTSNSMKKAFGAIGKASLVLGTAIVAGLGAAMVSGVKGIIAMEDQTAQLNAVLKSTKGAVGLTSKEISGMATALQLTTKFAEEETLAGQNMLLTFTNIGKDVFPQATTTLLDLATAMGTDAKSGAIQLGKALNDPTKGITALTRVGVTFTEEQKKVIKKLQETGDMAGAQKVILAELTKEFGGSAEAAGKTFSGKLVILKNSLGELTEGFASGIMPYLQKFMDWVNKNMPTIQAIMQKAFDVIGKVLMVVGNYITETVIPALQKLWEWIKPYIPLIQKYIVDMVNIVLPKFQKIIEVVGQIAREAFPDMKDGAKGLGSTVKDLVEKGLNLLIGALSWVRDNYTFVKTALEIIAVSMIAYKVAVIATNVQLAIQKGFLLFKGTAAAIEGVTVAQWSFNAAIAANPIGVFIGVLVLLAAALLVVKNYWNEINSAMGRATTAMGLYNNTFSNIPVPKKTPVITGGAPSVAVPKGLLSTYGVQKSSSNVRTIGGMPVGYANGVTNFTGGWANVNEKGGEIMNLPRGTQIIPHDVSMEMAKSTAEVVGNPQGGNINVNLIVDGKTLAQVVAPYTQQMARSRGRGMGVVAT